MFYHYLLIYIFCKIICIYCEWVEIQQNNQETINNDEKLSIINYSDFIGSVLKQNNTFDMGHSQLLNEPQNTDSNIQTMLNDYNNKSKLITPESLTVSPKLIKHSDQTKTILNFQFSEPEIQTYRKEVKQGRTTARTRARTTKKTKATSKTMTTTKPITKITIKPTTMSQTHQSEETDSGIMSKIRDTAMYDKIKLLKSKLSYLGELRQEILDTLSTCRYLFFVIYTNFLF